jgi:hypothetical protein
MEEESDVYCKICNDDDYYLDYDITSCCENIICTSCISNITKYICPICSQRLTYNFIAVNNLPIFNPSLIHGNNRKQYTNITAIITDDLEYSREMKKIKFLYRHWYQWSLSIKKFDFISACEELAGYWETNYSTSDIVDITTKLKKDENDDALETESEFNIMPNKIFIYNNHFAFMFERTDESESIFIDKVIETY